MKKILVAFGEPISYGGQESFVFRTIGKMNRKGLSYDFLTPYYADNEHYIDFIKSINSKLYTFKLPFNIGKSRFNVIKSYKEILAKNHYDIVHINSGSISILALLTLYAKKAGVKRVIVHSHMAGEHQNFKHEILKKIYNPIFLRKADVLIAPTKVAAYWQFSHKVFEEKGIILKNGINLQKYIYSVQKRKEYRQKISYDNNNIVLGHVGRFSPEKNQTFLINLLEYCITQNKNFRLLLIGSGSQKDYLKELIYQKKLEHYVDFLGNVNNVEDYLQAMDIFIFPSKYEGLGIVSIEAQAAGLPVLASKNIPADIKITNRVRFLSLNKPFEYWYSNILDMISKNKRQDNQQLSNHEYDVRDTAEKLRNIYLG